MKSAPAIAFEYRPSRLLALAIVMLTLLALMALALCGLAWWIKLPLAGCAIVYATFSLSRFWRTPPIKVTWHTAGHWLIFGLRDQETVAELDHAVVHAGFIVLTLRCNDGKRLRLPLSPDICDPDTRRWLRVRLARSQEDAPGVAQPF